MLQTDGHPFADPPAGVCGQLAGDALGPGPFGTAPEDGGSAHGLVFTAVSEEHAGIGLIRLGEQRLQETEVRARTG